jgi:hypothetical protein
MRAAIDALEAADDKFACLLAMAETFKGLDTLMSAELLEQSLSCIGSEDEWSIVRAVSQIVTLARELKRHDLAVSAVKLATGLVSYKNHDTVRALARLVANESVDVDLQLLTRLLAPVEDPFTKGRVVARVQHGEDYVSKNSGNWRLRLAFRYLVAGAAMAAAAKGATISSELVDRVPDPASKASLLKAAATAQAKQNPGAAKELLVRSIEILRSAKAALMNLSKSSNPFVRIMDQEACQAVETLARIDPEFALQNLDDISARRKCLVLATIGSEMVDKPERAKAVFRQAFAIAQSDNPLPDRFSAIVRVATFS